MPQRFPLSNQPRRALGAVALVLTTALGLPADAEVAASGPSGFVVKIETTLAAEPGVAFDRFLQVSQWWNGAHTYSGKPSNLTLQNQPGGCFCESLDGGGFVRHGTVEFSSRGKTLRLSGALGPLQGMGAYGLMALSFSKLDAGTKLVVTYTVSGFAVGSGYAEIAAPVNDVISDQFARFKRFAETGKPGA